MDLTTPTTRRLGTMLDPFAWSGSHRLKLAAYARLPEIDLCFKTVLMSPKCIFCNEVIKFEIRCWELFVNMFLKSWLVISVLILVLQYKKYIPQIVFFQEEININHVYKCKDISFFFNLELFTGKLFFFFFGWNMVMFLYGFQNFMLVC